MATGKFVSYLRVSTDKQGKSGLGLEAQRRAVEDYLNGGRWKLVAEFVEVESGKKNDRPKLREALHRAKVTGATLIVAKLDRLSRNAAFLLTLRDSGVNFVAADIPDANTMTIGVLAVIAQHERETISQRTKAAMAAAKRRGATFGNPNGARALRGLGNGSAVKAVKVKADKHAKDIWPIVEDIRAAGVVTLKSIAEELNDRGILTARKGQWYPTTVKNLIERVTA